MIERLPIGDLFAPSLDSELRSGIGHHSTHYESTTDAIALYDDDHMTPSRTIGYTSFCDHVVQLFAAFALAAMYHHWIHLRLNGAMK